MSHAAQQEQWQGASPEPPPAFFARFAMLNGALFCCLAAACVAGWVWPLIASDRTYMTAGICLLMLVGLALVPIRRWTWVGWIADLLPTLGLLGTVIGLAIAISGSEGNEYSLRSLGVATALNTTIAGIIGRVWLSLNEMALRPSARSGEEA
jgi:peptidoglycan/LPS O-acetylase OafA/YrhL